MAPALPSRRSLSAPKLCNTSSGVLKKGRAGKKGFITRASGGGRGGPGGELWRLAPCVSVCRSLASSMGRMELSRVEMRAASRLHIAPNTLRSSSRRDTRCSCAVPERQRAERLLQRCCRSKNSSSEKSVILNVLPSDNRRPETARSHSGWPCTSSCTPLGLHQSEEEENAQSLAVTAVIISHHICRSRIRLAVAAAWRTTGDYTACQTDPCREADPDPCFGRDKHSIFGSLWSVPIQAVATLFNLKSRLSPSDPIKNVVWPLGCCCGNAAIHPRKVGGRGGEKLLWMNEYYRW